jgi:hypothetical protein
MVKAADFVVPRYLAAIDAVVFVATATVVTGNVTVLLPAGTTTLAGTLAATLVENNWMVVPPTGATPLRVTVAVEFNPPTTVVGFNDTETTDVAVTVMTAETFTPAA